MGFRKSKSKTGGVEVTFYLIGLGWLVGWFLFWRSPNLEDTPKRTSENPSVSVIIPARNEAETLPILLYSLQHQTVPPSEVLVVNDHSTDQTAAIALSYGARVITPPELPEGWQGKSYACYSGAKVARGDLLLFLDADTFLSNQGLERLITTFKKGHYAALTVQPYHKIKKPYEHLSAFFNLIIPMSVGCGLPPRFARYAKGGFGPCFFCSKECYDQVEGHQSVQHKVLEHYHLSEVFRSHHLKVAHFLGKNVISFRMYPEGLGQLISGWSKSFLTGASQTSPLPLIGVIIWMIGCFSFFSFLSKLNTLNQTDYEIFGVLYFAYVLQFTLFFKRISNFGVWTALLFPIPLAFYLFIFARSIWFKLIHRPVTWKGRNVSSTKRGKHV